MEHYAGSLDSFTYHFILFYLLLLNNQVMSVLILDISLICYFLLQYELLHNFKNCSIKS